MYSAPEWYHRTLRDIKCSWTPETAMVKETTLPLLPFEAARSFGLPLHEGSNSFNSSVPLAAYGRQKMSWKLLPRGVGRFTRCV